MFCPSCGTGVPGGDRFCRACGGSLVGLPSPEPVRPVEPAHPPPPVVEARPRPPRSRGRILPVALRLVSLAGLATSAVGGWMLVRPPAQAAPDPLAAGATVVAHPRATPHPAQPPPPP